MLDYCFNGKRWENYNFDKRVDNEWQIEGNWKLCEGESGSGILFRLQIESFDSESFSGEGQCKFGYTTFLGEKKLETYSISEAKIYENGDKLVIWFDGGDNIEIGQDKSTAFCGAWIKKIEWASPNYLGVEPKNDTFFPKWLSKVARHAAPQSLASCCFVSCFKCMISPYI